MTPACIHTKHQHLFRADPISCWLLKTEKDESKQESRYREIGQYKGEDSNNRKLGPHEAT